MKNGKAVIWVSIVLLQTCCAKQKKIAPTFYYWQTTLSADTLLCNYLDQVGCKTLYIKILDVGRDPVSGNITPYARLLVADTLLLHGRDWVPCVFLTNDVFADGDADQMDWLAAKTAAAVAGFDSLVPHRLNELQVDCDWTGRTREAFFSYLTKLKAKLGEHTLLSATIRLHQYKYPDKTGVPPVDRGMLMAYNTGDIGHFAAGNAIYLPEDADAYWGRFSKNYPLPLDLALPLFSWTLIFRDSLLYKIIPGIPDESLADTARFEGLFASADLCRYRVQKETFLEGHYLRPGDLLRTELMTPELVRMAAEQVNMRPDRYVAFFHLDTLTANRFPPPQIKRICEPFHTAF